MICRHTARIIRRDRTTNNGMPIYCLNDDHPQSTSSLWSEPASEPRCSARALVSSFSTTCKRSQTAMILNGVLKSFAIFPGTDTHADGALTETKSMSARSFLDCSHCVSAFHLSGRLSTVPARPPEISPYPLASTEREAGCPSPRVRPPKGPSPSSAAQDRFPLL